MHDLTCNKRIFNGINCERGILRIRGCFCHWSHAASHQIQGSLCGYNVTKLYYSNVSSTQRKESDYASAASHQSKEVCGSYGKCIRITLGQSVHVPIALTRGHDLGNSIRDETCHISSIPLNSPINLKIAMPGQFGGNGPQTLGTTYTTSNSPKAISALMKADVARLPFLWVQF
ncbi:hypothetical protein AVEN_148931-1 [Araneus ventricosus]|uniref:Uncharacterized protein n=1 Tax=Araneus ventricosus TaxID=182803 RepID=A0A4Y2P3P6_ARAVE|nr:hypothetical protein AVEN_148931-1 [Araneus ventricosus]